WAVAFDVRVHVLRLGEEFAADLAHLALLFLVQEDVIDEGAAQSEPDQQRAGLPAPALHGFTGLMRLLPCRFLGYRQLLRRQVGRLIEFMARLASLLLRLRQEVLLGL